MISLEHKYYHRCHLNFHFVPHYSISVEYENEHGRSKHINPSTTKWERSLTKRAKYLSLEGFKVVRIHILPLKYKVQALYALPVRSRQSAKWIIKVDHYSLCLAMPSHFIQSLWIIWQSIKWAISKQNVLCTNN